MRRHPRQAASARLTGTVALALFLSGLGMAIMQADVALADLSQRLAALQGAAAESAPLALASGPTLAARAAGKHVGGANAGLADAPAEPPEVAAGRVQPYPFPLSWPAPGGITTYFHERGPYWVGGYHQGIDIAAAHGVDVHAAADGLVLWADGDWNRGYGVCVEIDHGGGIHTFYAHLSALAVEAGQAVTRGQVIGKVGASGVSVGPHLHFEVRRDGELDDPLAYLPLERP